MEQQRKNEENARTASKRPREHSPVQDSVRELVAESGAHGVNPISGLPASSQAALLMNAGSTEHRAGLAMQLQHSHGNAYVQALLSSKPVQAKLTVSRPEDASEREADIVADLVTEKVNSPVQRQEEEEEEIQACAAQQSRQTTVQRNDEESTVTSEDGAQPAEAPAEALDPARATVRALWNSIVVGSVREAHTALSGSGPARSRARQAQELIATAMHTAVIVRNNYTDNPDLYRRLAVSTSRLQVLDGVLSHHAGIVWPLESIAEYLDPSGTTEQNVSNQLIEVGGQL